MSVALFWSVVVGFLAGVFLRSFLLIGLAEMGLLGLLGLAVLAVAWIARANVRWPAVFCVALLACAGGILRAHGATLAGDPALNERLGQKVILEGYIFDEPDSREASMRLSIRVDRIATKNATTTVSAGVLVIAPPHAAVAYGDRVRAEGALRLPEAFDAGEGRAFSYPAYLAKDGIAYELAFATVEKVGEGKRHTLKAAAIWVKQAYLKGLTLALPEPQAGLAGGITAGDKRGLGKEWSEIFRTVGLTHIVVLSGYNIMIVMYGISWLLEKARVRGWTEAVIGIGVALFFALITGLASASVRAALMASIAFVNKALGGRTYIALRALAVVAFLMVLWNPWILAFDPGFQLSVIATWGLISLAPLIAPRMQFVTTKLNLREIAATTMGTQLAVLPLLLYQTGQISLAALPANLAALIAVPWAMLFALTSGIAGLAAEPLAPVIGFPAYALLSYILLVAEWAARMPFASVSVGAFGVPLLVILYLMLFVAVFMKKDARFLEKYKRK